MHETSSFLTLSYNDDHLPDDYGISNRDFQLFMKRLRRALEPKRVRYYACGEYGDTDLRPHYHICLFGYDFPDKERWKKTERGDWLYRSSLLEEIWSDPADGSAIGHVWVATFTPETAGYVARYVTKKMNGPPARDHYIRRHPLTNVISQVQPETSYMSKRPGIGQPWFERYETDCFPKDFVVIDGEKFSIPKAFSRKLKERTTSDVGALVERNALEPIANKRRERSRQPAQAWNNTAERLETRHELQLLRAKQLKRL